MQFQTVVYIGIIIVLCESHRLGRHLRHNIGTSFAWTTITTTTAVIRKYHNYHNSYDCRPSQPLLVSSTIITRRRRRMSTSTSMVTPNSCEETNVPYQSMRFCDIGAKYVPKQLLGKLKLVKIS